MRFSRVCSAVSGTIAALALAGAASAAQVNLIPNGDFESGNLLFGSDYANAPTANTVEGQYTVTTNPYPWNLYFALAGDHGEGAGGNMLVGNGTPTNKRAWYTEVPVAADTHYSFEAFVMNVCCNPNYGTAKQPVAGLTFYANGVEIASRTPSSIGLWESVSGTWFSGESESLVLELRSTNFERSGNDFAVDDIALYGTVNTPEPGTLVLTGHRARRPLPTPFGVAPGDAVVLAGTRISSAHESLRDGRADLRSFLARLFDLRERPEDGAGPLGKHTGRRLH